MMNNGPLLDGIESSPLNLSLPMNWRARLLNCLGIVLIALLAGLATHAHGEEVDPAVTKQEVARLIADLDADGFDVRRAAANRLEILAARQELASLLTSEFQAVMKAPKVSLEVRSVLEPLLTSLAELNQKPADTDKAATKPVETVREISPGEINRLLDELDADSYQVRTAAQNQLQSLIAEGKFAGQALVSMKLRLADPDLSAESRLAMRRLSDQARAAWLLSDSDSWKLPDPSPGQFAGWLDDLARPVPDEWKNRSWPVHENATQELLDLLVRDEWVPKVKAELQTRLATEAALTVDGVPTETAVRLKRVLDWTHPAMVAEFWQAGHHRGIQHLLIGIPNHSPNAERASHFDRCNDEVAHCVSGNTLSPGDYPVGVYFPHPRYNDAQFHLVNLPTPRRRLAYEHRVKLDDEKRFVETSQRTVAWLLKQKRPLTESETIMLRHLDPQAVSKFAGKYFSAIDDEPFRPDLRQHHLAGRISRHGLLCAVLSEAGTKDAIPGLLAAIKAGRFLPPVASTTDGEAGYDMPWIAALSIAGRDPWPEVDEWLAGLIERNSPLVLLSKDPPDLGASAAALLLRRHSVLTETYTLTEVVERQLDSLECPSFRFAIAQKRAEVVRWWAERKNHVAANGYSQP